MKSKTLAVLLLLVVAIAVVVFGTILWGVGTYNSLVSMDEGVKSAWGQVENQYQRRYDLVPNLVETVRGYASHEKEVFEEVTKARASVGQLKVSSEILKDPAAFQRFQQAQDGLSAALTRLLAVAENYPNLKANENFLTLQAQLEGAENRIAVERRRFNEQVQRYNTTLRRFPASIIASMTGFTARPYFQAQAGAEQAPRVRF
ncbi:MAG: LemA family protein [Bacteroidota bacterium]